MMEMMETETETETEMETEMEMEMEMETGRWKSVVGMPQDDCITVTVS